MHNIKRNFDRIHQTIKSLNLAEFNQDGNLKKTERTPKISDLEIISLNLTSEYMSIDSENLFFKKLKSCHADDFPRLIDRTQFNRRKKHLFYYLDKIRLALAKTLIEFEDHFIVDSMPLQICKIAREKIVGICREAYLTSPDKGYCASQGCIFLVTNYMAHAQ